MKKLLAGTAALGMLAGIALAADQPMAAPAADQTTLTGEVVDMNCFMAHGAKGEGHKKCALKCFKDGGAAGILSGDGSVYLVVNHAGKELKGMVLLRPGNRLSVMPIEAAHWRFILSLE